MAHTSGEVAQLLGGELVGDASVAVTGLNAFDLAEEGDLTFAGSASYLDRIDETKASVVLVSEEFEGTTSKVLIKVKDPKTSFVLLLSKFYVPESPAAGIAPSAIVSDKATIGVDVHIGANAVVEDAVTLGDGTAVGAGCVIGRGTSIGAGCRLHANVTLYHELKIGENVVIHSGSVIGADGFGYVEHEGAIHKVPQTGTVDIAANVEIGANATIDRATFGATVIGENSKIDNLCQIAHNATIGKNVRVAGQSGVSGSTTVGDFAILAAQSGIRDNITIGERAVVLAKAGVSHSVKPGELVFGIPARKHTDALKQMAAVRRLAPHATALARMAAEVEKAKKND